MPLRLEICKRVALSCAHQLPLHKGRCRRLHGHNYSVDVFATGPTDETGMVIDFEQMSAVVHRVVVDHCDHRNLNDLYPDMQTTAENLARRWLLDLSAAESRIFRVRVWETRTCYAEATADGDT